MFHKKEKLTQEDRILRHLKKKGSITRLSAKIYNLKNNYNVKIKDEFIKRKNRYGEVVYFKKYMLDKK